MLSLLLKNWKYALIGGLIVLLAFQQYRFQSVKLDLMLEQSEREKDRLVYEQNIEKINSESQRVLNEVNAKIIEKERIINESWNEKLNGALKENAELETTITDLSTRTDSLLNTISTLRRSQSNRGQSGSQVAEASKGFSPREWDVLNSCIREYTNMATDADRVIQEFRLLNDWKEIIITEIVE